MSFVLVAHDKLKQSIKESIISLIKYHHPSRTVDPDKLVESIVLLPDERRTQAEFLLKVCALTDAMDASSIPAAQKRARILNAAVFYITAKIDKSYDEGYISGFLPRSLVSSEWSNFFKSLRTALNINTENTPNDTDKKDMYVDLKSFLSSHVYHEGKAERGHLDKGMQAFFTVYQYNITNDIEDLSERVATLESALRKKAEKLYKESQKPASAGGLLGWLSGKPASPVVAEEPKEVASAAPRV